MLTGCPPGSGKTLLARSLPPLDPPEHTGTYGVSATAARTAALDVTRIYSVAGTRSVPGDVPLIRHRLFRARWLRPAVATPYHRALGLVVAVSGHDRGETRTCGILA